MKLDEGSLTPLYQQVMGEIRKGIEDGSYNTGDKIPSEVELSEMYSVSRITVRRAVEELVGEGILTKKQGKGTYVTKHKVQRKITQESMVQSFSEMCQVNGLTPGAHVVERDVVSGDKISQDYQGVSPEDRFVYIRRVRTADGLPIMLETNYYPYDRFEFLLETDLEDVSLFEVIERVFGFKPGDSSPTLVQITLATADIAHDLSINVGEPLFQLDTYLTDDRGEPLFYEHQYVVGNRFSLVI